MTKTITFYEELQKNDKLDKRDKRGLKHDVSLVLLEFVLALLCSRDGNLSSIHRHMVSHHNETVTFLGLEKTALKKQYVAPIFQKYLRELTGRYFLQ